MTLWPLSPGFVQFKNNLKPDDEKKLQNNASVHVEALLDQIPKSLSVNSVISPPLSSPNHPDAPYHFFVREVYSFFKVRDEKFNKWSLLARICNATGLFPLCDSNKARGTCRDLAQEFASPF